MSERRTVPTPHAMEELGSEIGARLRAGDLLVLDGPLGAGKTTLTRGIGAGLGVRGPVTSPTFVLARTHPSVAGGPPLVHVDAYRLGSPGELDDLDLDFAGSVVVVEWGAGMLAGISPSVLTVSIERPLGRSAPGPASGPASAAVVAAQAVQEVEAVEAVEAVEPLEPVEPVEPRVVGLAGSGPRWAGTPWAAESESGS